MRYIISIEERKFVCNMSLEEMLLQTRTSAKCDNVNSEN